MSKVLEKFLKYVKFDTMSCEESNSVPSTDKQLVLGKELVKELEAMGMKDASIDENGYVMAVLPSNMDKKVPSIGFIAHMDTSPDMSGANVNPIIIEKYDGKDVILNEKENIVLRTKDFPEIKEYEGKDLITTDGTTLLGADDKAGIAEIMAAVEYLIEHPEIKHGDVKVAFTPDEEIGRGADQFNIEKFGADLAYTMDGGAIGELEYENFNASSAKIIINGRNVHPGYAKNKMINSMIIAGEFIGSMPEQETPQNTDEYDGFYHLISVNGSVEKTELNYIIRDFRAEGIEERKSFIKKAVEKLNNKYGEGTLHIEVKDQYRNMKEKVEPVKYVVDIAFKAMEAVGVKPLVRPIRGGTDGAQLSFKGLPTPNIFTGGQNFHGKFEYIPIFAMEKATKVIVEIVKLYSEMDK